MRSRRPTTLRPFSRLRLQEIVFAVAPWAVAVWVGVAVAATFRHRTHEPSPRPLQTLHDYEASLAEGFEEIARRAMDSFPAAPR